MFTIVKHTSLLRKIENCQKIYFSVFPQKNCKIVLFSTSTTLLENIYYCKTQKLTARNKKLPKIFNSTVP